MVPPTETLNLSITAISGILGSISIACWIVVFSPQIVENFRRGSADGLSLQFIIVWLAGDVFNILGSVLQGVLPTMLILAIYYTIADVVLLVQCFHYRGFTWKDEVVAPKQHDRNATGNGNGNGYLGEADERTGLLAPADRERSRRPSSISASHLSPAVPLLDEQQAVKGTPPSALQATLFNLVAILMVIAAGILGWYISNPAHSSSSSPPPHHPEPEPLVFHLWGQVFGYLCAVLYLGSRVPQLLLNHRRKSTEGVSMLFFLFACIGNLTYVLSIFAYEPRCAGFRGKCVGGEAASLYRRYILINASWLAGSLGTLCLDAGIFAQFFIYRELRPVLPEIVVVVAHGDVDARRGSRDSRPLLDRDD